MASPWIWDSASKRYRGRAGTPYAGQYIGSDKMVAMRDHFVESQYAAVDDLALRLSNGDITIQEWVTEFRGVLKETYYDSYFAAKGGRHTATQADHGRLGQMLRQQYGWLNKFAEAAKQGKTPEYLAWRSRLYIDSAVQAFERGQAVAWGIDLPAYPGDGQTECLVKCRCHWSLEDADDFINAWWILDPDAESCDDCIENGEVWSPLVVPKVEE